MEDAALPSRIQSNMKMNKLYIKPPFEVHKLCKNYRSVACLEIIFMYFSITNMTAVTKLQCNRFYPKMISERLNQNLTNSTAKYNTTNFISIEVHRKCNLAQAFTPSVNNVINIIAIAFVILNLIPLTAVVILFVLSHFCHH